MKIVKTECSTCGGGGKAIWESQLMNCGACDATGEIVEEIYEDHEKIEWCPVCGESTDHVPNCDCE